MLADANDRTEVHLSKPRLTSAERRAAIVKAAMDLFSRRGFSGTTTRELAMAVGVSEPVLYHHFPSKSDLYTAIVDEMVAQAECNFASLKSAEAAELEEEVFFQWLGEHILAWYTQETTKVRLLMYSGMEGHELADIWHERATTHLAGAVESYLEARARRSGYDVGDVRLTARAFIMMVAHYGLVWGIFRPKEFNSEPKEVVKRFVEIYLNGIRGEKASGAISSAA